MHCPRCGQQQVSDQTKFCSRCGFQLGLVGELLEHGGYLPQLAELQKGKSGVMTRRNGVIFSLVWLVFWMMLIPAFFAALGANRIPGAFAAFGFFSSVILLIVSLGLLRRGPKGSEVELQEMSSPASLYGNAAVGALPPQQEQPASTYMPPEGSWRVPDTDDLARPGSVIESTTRLLKKDE